MADEIFKEKLQQIRTNDEQIGTNDLEIKGQVNALLQYGMGVTGIQRDRLGDVVYDLADGYGQGGGGGEKTIILDTIMQVTSTGNTAILSNERLTQYNLEQGDLIVLKAVDTRGEQEGHFYSSFSVGVFSGNALTFVAPHVCRIENGAKVWAFATPTSGFYATSAYNTTFKSWLLTAIFRFASATATGTVDSAYHFEIYKISTNLLED